MAQRRTDPVSQQLAPTERNEAQVEQDDRIQETLKNIISCGTHPETDQQTSVELLALTSKALQKLATQIQIDSTIYYNPRELPPSQELSRTQTASIEILGRKIRLISTLTDLLEKKIIPEDSSRDQDEILLLESNFECRCEMIYRLSCWCSMGYSNDEWELRAEHRDKIMRTIDRLWRLPHSIEKVPLRGWNINLEIAYIILEKQIKPLFARQHLLSSRHLNPATGRKIERKQDHLFAPRSDSLDEPLWKLEGIGFWNAICLLLERLHQDPGLKEIWPLLIPPIITLAESSIPRYRLRGIQLSIALLEDVPPLIICQTGINSILQNAFSTTFSLLNIEQTHALLSSGFEASKRLIEVEWRASGQTREAQAARYEQLNRLLAEAIFNPLAFCKSHSTTSHIDLHLFAVTRLAEIARELGFGIARYVRVILPYLCETLLSLHLSSTTYNLVIEVNELIGLLFKTCREVIEEWRSRLIVVFSTCWIEWTSSSSSEDDHPLNENNNNNKPSDPSSSFSNNNNRRLISEEQIDSLHRSIIRHTFMSFINPTAHPDHPRDAGVCGVANDVDHPLSDPLLQMINSIQHSHPSLTRFFAPLFTSP
ncbi:uncharacterized protein PGTG_08321 [Puccinia graminis f. sp. tritici CRL 75-36-700-3]|uniref:Uncharacterized protein n=1 Tax=Puccinia graminis f. sp. tritici (strain CRL 75-36-700-3 / race SCCL) TaxID=418459 RepID=E3KE08_PUCGT|nr:uncharacterized protein PGTG_08321 [Puccinia graminis f. sp. tritici CRL 75-36-700-3]EFP82365.1 hypothetical protein PGTG_08321 [Puccinia graminis f. sp. tritici CRL 75-36-700-3]